MSSPFRPSPQNNDTDLNERTSLLPGPSTSTSAVSQLDNLPQQEQMGRPSVSASTYLQQSLFSDLAGGMAQLGLLVAMLQLWWVLYKHPAGLFSWHPALQSCAIIGFAEGVLLLQPPPKNQAVKQKGLTLHQVFQFTALPVILAGSSVIIYNKAIHAAKHITTWHALFGLITLSLLLLQIIFGAFVVYSPLTKIFGGDSQAKAAWKYHRITGYLTLSFLFATPLLALDSDWVHNNSSFAERLVIGSGLGVTALGVLTRISLGKLGVRRT
ncbi:hypothetical protein BCR35DRAFT_301361 [Leucosporidium creatinivorum]|uniref:Cytochrome b561 domain-containing protein n=1 Tax=Leucosporidium creatinivorum TaxID=106004 RepID=A0A1Y2FZF8_9BASI|nr:hypothetical protein BCR35DRAFT_301361 [Leucosporidium creatinivorum]